MSVTATTRVGATDPVLGLSETVRVTWNVVELSRAHLADLEERSNTILAVIIAAMLAIWSTITDFDPGATRSVVYAAWAIVVLSVFIHGAMVVPRQTHALAEALKPRHVLARARPLTPVAQCELACVVSACIDREVRRISRSIRWAIGLNLLALALIVGAYGAELV